jgi:hypothetical protein
MDCFKDVEWSMGKVLGSVQGWQGLRWRRLQLHLKQLPGSRDTRDFFVYSHYMLINSSSSSRSLFVLPSLHPQSVTSSTQSEFSCLHSQQKVYQRSYAKFDNSTLQAWD